MTTQFCLFITNQTTTHIARCNDRKDKEDTTRFAQIEEVNRNIWALPFVSKLSPVGGRNSHGDGCQVSLRYPASEEYGNCGKKQKPPVQVFSVHPTEFACLEELLKRLQHRHVDCTEAVTKKADVDSASSSVSPDTPDVMQAMIQIQQAKSRAEVANKISWRRRRKGMLLKEQWKN
jgi:hypothetical protein